MSKSKGIERLSAAEIAKLNKKGRYADGGNLWLDVHAGGLKSWLFRRRPARSYRRSARNRAPSGSAARIRSGRPKCASRRGMYRLMLVQGLDPRVERSKQRRRGRQPQDEERRRMH